MQASRQADKDNSKPKRMNSLDLKMLLMFWNNFF